MRYIVFDVASIIVIQADCCSRHQYLSAVLFTIFTNTWMHQLTCIVDNIINVKCHENVFSKGPHTLYCTT